MRKDKFHEWIKRELESEAQGLEKKTADDASEDAELAGLQMPEDAQADLLRRIRERHLEEPKPKAFHVSRRALAASFLAAVLLAAVGIGASGERLFAPKVEGQIENGEYNVTIASGDEEIYKDMSEEEAYDEIEERLGILALRLGYKPREMELTKVFIDENTGEAQMDFVYGDYVLRIYENKQSGNAAFDAQVDGKIIDSVELFHYNDMLEILEVDGDEISPFYAVQLEMGNAYYRITSGLELKEFEEIVKSIFLANM